MLQSEVKPKRNASLGEDALMAPPEHVSSSVRFRGLLVEGTNDGSFRRSSSRARHSISHLDSDALSVDSAHAHGVGTMASFRSAAMARHFLNKSRRHILKEKSIQESIHDGTEVENSETTPLRDSIPATDALPEYDTVEALKSIIVEKPVSVFLLLIPFAFWSHYGGWGAEYIFWLNFCVMIPLASILGDFTEEAALHTNDTIGGLLNATFGNAVEVVVAIQAMLANEIRVVQASLIGSIFSNLLLVLGCCFFFGGLYHKEQVFNSTSATANMGLLALSSIAMVLPTPFAEYYNVQDHHVLIISRCAALFLLCMYVQLLVFQLYTHKDIFDEEESSLQPKVNGGVNGEEEGTAEENEEEDEDEKPSISMKVALIGLCLTTLSVAVFSDYLVESIDDFCESSGISRTFVGLIILPIVGNAVEHITAVTVAMKNKMDLAMGVAVGSCTQISLFVVPLTVLVGWAMDKPMTLNFPHFEITLYILSVFTVSVCLSNPRGNWLEGSLLITTYIMIAIGFWFEKVINFR